MEVIVLHDIELVCFVKQLIVFGSSILMLLLFLLPKLSSEFLQ